MLQTFGTSLDSTKRVQISRRLSVPFMLWPTSRWRARNSQRADRTGCRVFDAASQFLALQVRGGFRKATSATFGRQNPNSLRPTHLGRPLWLRPQYWDASGVLALVAARECLGYSRLWSDTCRECIGGGISFDRPNGIRFPDAAQRVDSINGRYDSHLLRPVVGAHDDRCYGPGRSHRCWQRMARSVGRQSAGSDVFGGVLAGRSPQSTGTG